MERKLKNVVLKEGNLIELPQEVLKVLNTKVGEELKLLYTDDAVILMNSSKFGEELLKKI